MVFPLPKGYKSLERGSLLAGNRKGKPPNKAVLVMSFDDGYTTDYSSAFVEMGNRGIKGTSFINPAKIGTTNFMTWPQVTEMNNAGWDFQCHTNTHARLTDLTDAEIRAELEAVETAFANNGLPAPQHHAYPYGAFDANVKNIVGEYRITQRRTGTFDAIHLNSYHNIVWNDIKAVNCDIQSSGELQQVKDTITQGVNERKIIFLYGHQIVDTATASAQIETTYFLDMLNHIEATGVETVTVSELYNKVNG